MCRVSFSPTLDRESGSELGISEMNAPFLTFMGALAAILVWALATAFAFRRRIDKRARDEKALAERKAVLEKRVRARAERLFETAQFDGKVEVGGNVEAPSKAKPKSVVKKRRLARQSIKLRALKRYHDLASSGRRTPAHVVVVEDGDIVGVLEEPEKVFFPQRTIHIGKKAD